MGRASQRRNLNDEQVLYAMNIDDAYCVEQVLSRNAGCLTELVTLDGAGPFVRKKIPHVQARRAVWTALGECDSASLPLVQTTYELPGHFVVVHDYVAGKSLADYVASKGKLSADEAVSLILNICEAVAQLHARHVVHCDLTPANIIVSDDGAHVIDFGNARIEGEPVPREQARQGVVGFAAPEQYGFADVDARSDIYSIGSLLGFMLTGVMPADETFDRALEDENVVSPYLRQVIEVARAFAPSDRFANVAAMARALGSSDIAAGVDASWRDDTSTTQSSPDPQQRVNLAGQRSKGPAERKTSSKWAAAAKWALLVAAIVTTAWALVMATFSFLAPGPSEEPAYEKLDWSEGGLSDVLPEPPHDEGKIYVYDGSVSATIAHSSRQDFEGYVDACKANGFAIDSEQSTSDLYEAYSAQGYHVRLMYVEYNDEISVDLSHPLGAEQIAWPDKGPALLIPVPESHVGVVTVDNSNQFSASITQTNHDAFRSYVETCADAGFTVDYSNSSNFYQAYDEAGNSITLEYAGFETMDIDVYTVAYHEEWDLDSGTTSSGSSDDSFGSTLFGQLLSG